MIFTAKTYQDFGSKIIALVDLLLSKHKYTIYFARALIDREEGLLRIDTVLRTFEGKEYTYPFVVDLNLALTERQGAGEIAEVEAKKTIEAYTEALDTYGG